MHKEKCCTIGKYHNGVATDLDCSDTDIPAAEDCTKYNDSNECIECAANHTLNHGICCDLSTEFYE